jgi:hypothetical protein
MNPFLRYFISFLGVITLFSLGKTQSVIKGKVLDVSGKYPVDFASVFIDKTTLGTLTSENGEFSLTVPSQKVLRFGISRLGYQDFYKEIGPFEKGQEESFTFEIETINNLPGVTIEARSNQMGGIRERVDAFKVLPTASGNFESVLPSIALGTNSGTGGELSSQYNVRGGNYDENLVYINDFEIYRPQLIRAGQQEGLSFPNIDLIRDISFSSGGFQPKYGDKLSSVLDIRYKIPDSLRASATASFLGASAHVEGTSKKKKFKYLVGARYKDTRYLLASQEIEGEYTPAFYDVQTWLTYDLNKDWQLGALGNFNKSIFPFKPQSRTTAEGLINFAIQLRSQYEGQQLDDFTNGFGGVSATYIPTRRNNPIFLKFMASNFRTLERERFDIIGNYRLAEIETGLGSDNFGEEINLLGSGVQQGFVRNTFFANVSNVEHRGGIEFTQAGRQESNFLNWGVKFQNEAITDRIHEWERIDSALYSLPYDTTQLALGTVYRSRNTLNSRRLTGFFQDTWYRRIAGLAEFQVTAGFRVAYWDLNQDWHVTPRAQFQYKPLNWKENMSFYVSGGLYYQPPFYRELRRINGTLNQNVLAQKSSQITAGWTWDIQTKRAKKPYRLITEAYYKNLWDLVSYDVENVRIRYSGLNDATGYATGLDMRLNGELVPDAESWINLSFLRTHEALNGITHLRRELGQAEGQPVADVPRPADRFFNISIFLQDYLPKNKNFRLSLQTTVGSGLPFGIPNNNIVYRNTYRLRPYHRVDMGMIWNIWNEKMLSRKPHHFMRWSRNAWMSLEIFNLLAVRNEANKTWIKTITNQQFAIGNNLTGRRINLRVRVDF